MGLESADHWPTISIVVSTYNAAELLRTCLTQLLRQTAIDECEVLVIDSGSEQDEAAVCAALHSRFPFIIYERTGRETIYGAWNRALAKARGTYFVNANTDDSLHPRALALLKRALDAHTDAAIAYGDWVYSGSPNAAFPWDGSYRYIRSVAYHPAVPLTYCYTGCTQFWRTDKLRALGGFPAARWAAGDYEALTEIVRRRWTAAYVPMPVAAYYINPDGLTLATNRAGLEFLEIRTAFRESIPISAIYELDEFDTKAAASGWAALAHRALHTYAPWASQPEPDFAYAAFAARKALDHDPACRPAQELLEALRTKRSLWDKMLRRRVDPSEALKLPRPTEPPPRVRPIIAAVD
jgi:glycosyltransferase involved in cell wall biosynthesis